MKRYQLNRVINDKGDNFRSELDSLTETYAIRFVSLIPTDQQGIPIYNFTMTRFAMGNIGPALLLPNSYTFPDFPLDGQLAAMDDSVRNAMVANVAAYDLDGNGMHIDTSHSLTESYGSFLQRILHVFEPAQNVLTFDVLEPQE